MRIGLDFDNTIACYDELFHRLAVEKGLIEPDAVVPNKKAVRDALRADGKEEDWILLQGEGYGPRIVDAKPYPGALAFVRRALEAGHDVRIISHKTRTPYRGPAHDLHQACFDFLETHGFFSKGEHGPTPGSGGEGLVNAGPALAREHVLLNLTKADKIDRIVETGREVFLDDLAEFLSESGFPPIRKVLFDPAGAHRDDTPEGCERIGSWAELSERLLA
ncbi:MAG: hypothetical protein AAF288_00045 [Planctomycetota bacterium]